MAKSATWILHCGAQKKTTQFLNWENINKVLRSVSRKRTHVNYASWFKGRGVWKQKINKLGFESL